MNKKSKIYLLIAIFSIILVIILTLTLALKNKVDLDKDYDHIEDDLNDEDLISTEEYKGEIIKVKNPGLAFEAYWAIKRLKVSSYSSEAMLSILDPEYLRYYQLNENNIKQKIDNYKGKEYTVVDMKYSYFNSTYLCFLTCEDGKMFLFKYSDNATGYTIFLDDYIEDIGYDNFIANKMELVMKEEIKSNEYTSIEGMVYDDDKLLENYKLIIKNFDNLYTNILDQDTKNRYSEDELRNIYNNEYSFFGSKFSDISLTKALNDNELFTYTFKDVEGRTYTITELSYFKFTLNIK